MKIRPYQPGNFPDELHQSSYSFAADRRELTAEMNIIEQTPNPQWN
jgi:hypothetical protein